tara:strand:- start:354 stop:1397 length:1044 start_codon:yes stop_codon:yes gene_type:complete
MAYTTINKSADYFNTKLYAGNNSSTHAITGVGFQPDWTWIKSRNFGESHRIFDAVRGASNHISSNANVAQSSSYPLTSFDSDGFTIGSSDGSVNGNYNYASWNWKANGQGSSNTTGSINTTYTSANTTSGFSIIKYNGNGTGGATIGHGLGAAPKLVIIKRTDTSSNWIVGHASQGFTKFNYFNTTDGVVTNAGAFNNTAPSSTVITLGTWNDVNNSSGTYIAYAFLDIRGYSKIGSYYGNGNADGQFVYLGFKPRYIVIKYPTSNGYDWKIYDSARDSYNGLDTNLEANTSDTEPGESNMQIDYLSNGFKMRNTNSNYNEYDYEYLFWAFAEAPLVGSNNTPNTAR